MSNDKPEVLGRAYQDAERWLIDIAERLQRPGELRDAYHALRAVLHPLRDNLIPDEAMDLANQLPVLVRGIYFEDYRLAGRPVTHRTRDAFLEAVARQLEIEGPVKIEVERCANAVFATLGKHLDSGQAEQVRNMLYKDVQALWSDT